MPYIKIYWSQNVAASFTRAEFSLLAQSLIEATCVCFKISNHNSVAVSEILVGRSQNAADIEIWGIARSTNKRKPLLEDWAAELFDVPKRLAEDPVYGHHYRGRKIEVFCMLPDGAFREVLD